MYLIKMKHKKTMSVKTCVSVDFWNQSHLHKKKKTLNKVQKINEKIEISHKIKKIDLKPKLWRKE